MSWFKVDDQLAFHAKSIMAGNSAMGLWVRAGSWASAHLTNGFIPDHMANAMANAMANVGDIEQLVTAGLWDEVEGGYVFHDWSHFQPDAQAEKQRRDEVSRARSEAGKKGAQARWEAENGHGKHGKRDGKPMANASSTDGKPMAPSRPVPSSPKEDNTSEVADATSDDAEVHDPNGREDIKGLLDYLDAAIASYDPAAKLPSRTKANKDAARLLLDKDGRTVDQVQRAIDFAQGSEFWRPNIRSMSKLRDKYDTLRLQAARPQQTAGGGQYASASEKRLASGAERLQRKLGDQLANPMEGRLIE